MDMNDERLIRDDETTGAVDGPGAQTSNKQGLQSSSRKPSNTGPGPHEQHKAPVSGAFGRQEEQEAEPQDTNTGTQAPPDKARK